MENFLGTFSQPLTKVRTFLVLVTNRAFRRCLVDPMRPRQADDVSKPLEDSFRHTGHADMHGNSWGNPTTIENLTFRKSKNLPEASRRSGGFSSPRGDRRKSKI